MNFPRRSESKADSDQTSSSIACLSGGDGYSLHRNTLSVLLPRHLLPSTALALEDCPVTLHDVFCIFHICFISGWGGLWILLLSPILLVSPKDKLFTLPGHFISTLDFATASGLLLMVEIQRLSVPIGYLPLPPSLDDGGEATDACQKCLINNWWQGSQSSCCLALTQKYWATQVKHTSRKLTHFSREIWLDRRSESVG